MKKLFLIRHAKSDWSNSRLKDIERPLNSRGKKDALLIGGELSRKYPSPDTVVCSPAKRAKKTAKKILSKFDYQGKVLFFDRLYDFDVDSYYRVVEQVHPKANNIFLFGHNPVISEFATDLTNNFSEDIPTCAAVIVELDIKMWIEITFGCGRVLEYLYPRMFK